MASAVARPLYLITDGGLLRREGRLVSQLGEILSTSGRSIFAIQLREQLGADGASDRELYHIARDLSSLCAEHGVTLIISRRWDIALAAGADGVHLGESSASLQAVRVATAGRLLIGYSAHTPSEARSALAAGADYLFCSPIWSPGSKPDDRRATLGLNGLQSFCSISSRPVFALGGVTAARAADCRAAGAAGVALISAVFSSPQPARAAEELIAGWGS